MYSRWQLARKYLQFYSKAENRKGHGVHSPFVYELIRTVLMDKTRYPVYDKIESLRSELKQDHSVLTIHDLGAGSVTGAKQKRTVSSIARTAAKSRKLGQLLFRLSKKYKPATILELGTSLGISGSYLASGAPESLLMTIEGSAAVAEKAMLNFQRLGLTNVQVIPGDFDQVLPRVLPSLKQPWMAYLDGNHRLEPTLRYFQQLLPYVQGDSVIIFDDIHWSAEMEEAWKQVRNQAQVRCSVDLFFIGLIFFRPEFREKQDFCVRF